VQPEGVNENDNRFHLDFFGLLVLVLVITVTVSYENQYSAIVRPDFRTVGTNGGTGYDLSESERSDATHKALNE